MLIRLQIISQIKKRYNKNFLESLSRLLHSRASGLLLGFTLIGVASIYVHLYLIVFPALFLIFKYFNNLKQTTSRRYYLDIYLAALLLTGVSYLFMFQNQPQNWTVRIAPWFSLLIQLLLWILVCAVSASAYLLLGVVFNMIKNKTVFLYILPLVWATAEIFKSILFFLTAYGRDASGPLEFNWGSISVIAADTPIIFLARYLGFYATGIIILYFALGVFLIVIRKNYSFGIAIIISIMVMSIVGVLLHKPDKVSLKVAAIHLHENEGLDLWKNWQDLPENVDVMVFPEYSAVTENKDFSKIAKKISDDGIGITSIVAGEPSYLTNQAVFFDKYGETIDQQDKTFLIPTGEYMPYTLKFLLKIFNQQKIIDNFEINQAIKTGSLPERPVSRDKVVIGSLICSGAVSTSKFAELRNMGAKVLTNSASLSFLTPDSFQNTYNRRMARYHAVTNRMPYVQSSRSGESYIVDAWGKIVARNKGQNTQILTYQF